MSHFYILNALSIVLYSSSDSATFIALALLRTCSAVLAPGMTTLISGFLMYHARTIWAIVASWLSAMGCKFLTDSVMAWNRLPESWDRHFANHRRGSLPGCHHIYLSAGPKQVGRRGQRRCSLFPNKGIILFGITMNKAVLVFHNVDVMILVGFLELI